MDKQVFLWVNVPDLTQMGHVAGLGNVLFFMLLPGDTLLDIGVMGNDSVDDMFCLIKCTDIRAMAIQGALEVIGKRKIWRTIRTRITKGMPTKGWKLIENLAMS